MDKEIELRYGDVIELTSCEDGELLIEVYENEGDRIELIFELPQVERLRDMLNDFIDNQPTAAQGKG